MSRIISHSSTSATELFEFTPEESDYLREGLQDANTRLSSYATRDGDALRKFNAYYPDYETNQDAYLTRPPFVIDVDKILHNPFFNRCSDKTQVFSLIKNDDITRRSYHLQLVSQIARRIGRALRLNVDLIEAIALGHDAGHTPFGHRGEEFLGRLYHQATERYFNHNVHSVRVLKDIAYCNLTVQTYNGMLCHCGERAFKEYRPKPCPSFAALEALVEECMVDEQIIATLRPSTLEGCVVRISDILAYIGKDRQDVTRVGTNAQNFQEGGVLGSVNLDIVEKASINIIKCSIGKDYISMDDAVAQDLERLRKENHELIYASHEAMNVLDELIWPMMQEIYEYMLDDFREGREESPLFTQFIDTDRLRGHFTGVTGEQVVCDYIASMTDNYFIDLYRHLFPHDPKSTRKIYRPYFE